jgi:hypothetical protein
MVEAGYQIRGRQPREVGTAALATDLDIQIAVDMAQLIDSADRIALVSGDNDFSYSVRAAVSRGIPVDIVALTPVVGRELVNAGGTPVDLMSVLANLAPENIEVDASAQENALWALKGLSIRNRKDLRALWYGVLLERTLRQLCEIHGIVPLPNDGIDGLSGKLMKAGVYPKLTHKKITMYAHIRNDAAHGQFDNYSERDVEEMEKWIGAFTADLRLTLGLKRKDTALSRGPAA